GVCARYIHSTDAVFDIRDYQAAKTWLTASIQTLNLETIEQLQYQ
ncbi:peptidase M28, partial [Staphylococcus pseudintermedius]